MSMAWRKKTVSLGVAAVLLALAPLASAQPENTKPDKQPEAKPAAKPPRQPEEMSLKVGDAAPAIKVEKWVKGSPVESFEKGKTYVVEFWATWCGPCKVSIPHLTEMQKQFKNVKFIGVSIWEPSHAVEDGTYLDRVQQFVKDQGDKMDYVVAYGGDEAPMAKTWMEASGQNGIPSAFVVNGEGKIAWIGHPMDMEKSLSQIVAGTYDMKGAAEKSAKAAAVEKKSRQLMARLQDAMQTKNKAEQLKVIDEFVELDAEKYGQMAGQKFKMLLKDDEKAAYAYATQVSEGAAKNSAQALNAIAWTILDDEGVQHRDYDIALAIAKRADEAAKHENAAITDTLARAYFEKGDTSKAVELETKALSQLKEGEEEMRSDMEDALKKYKAGKK